MAEDLPTCRAPRNKRGLCVGAFFHSKRSLSIVRCIYIILLFYSNSWRKTAHLCAKIQLFDKIKRNSTPVFDKIKRNKHPKNDKIKRNDGKTPHLSPLITPNLYSCKRRREWRKNCVPLIAWHMPNDCTAYVAQSLDICRSIGWQMSSDENTAVFTSLLLLSYTFTPMLVLAYSYIRTHSFLLSMILFLAFRPTIYSSSSIFFPCFWWLSQYFVVSLQAEKTKR